MTPVGELSFEEYFVERWYQDPVESVRFAGAADAEPAPGVIEAIKAASPVILAPSNPVTSIGPIHSVPGIRDALSDPTQITPQPIGQTIDPKVGQATTTLTPRQRDVLQLLAEGLSMKEIGHALNLATRTVAFHKYRIMEILDLHSNAELVQFAIRKHLVFVDTPIKSHIGKA